MNYNCERCHDTGSLSKDIDGGLDCACCGVADERLALEKWALEEKLDVSVGALWRIREHVVAAQPAGAGAPSDGTHQFRKKPVVIEAIQWPGNKFETSPPEWFTKAMHMEPEKPGFVIRWGDDIIIETLEGRMRAAPGDWIIQGIKGEIYPCKPDIFAATYEPARQGAAPAQAEPVGYVRLLKNGTKMGISFDKLDEPLIDGWVQVPVVYATAPAHAGVAQADGCAK